MRIQPRSATCLRDLRTVAAAVCLASVLFAAPSYGQVTFFDDFDGPGLNPVYQAALPDAAWRGNQFPNFAYGNVATYRGGPDYSFETLDGASVLHLRNWIPTQSRRGVSTSTVFAADKEVRLEVRFNTLVQSPVTAWDELLELWVLDSSDLNRYDVVTIMGIGLGVERQFSAWSSISGAWVDTGHNTSESGFPFLDNTWYRMVITGSPSQEVRASIWADDGRTELIGFNLGHDLSVFSAGFKIGFSQSQGALDAFSDCSIDWLRLSVVPEPTLLTFYNNSSWDGGNGAANTADDNAIATDKTALLAGSKATFANYTSYDKGINGLMIDVYGLPGTPTVNDFLFRCGNDDEPYGNDLNDPADDWPWAPDPIAIAVRPGAGRDGADRVTLIWQDGAIRNCWLQVTVLATDATGLSEDKVFYVGNAVGESGDSTTDAIVNATDEIGARNNPHSPFTPAPKEDRYDFNRDKLVNATDQIIVRNNRTSPFTALKLITPPTTH